MTGEELSGATLQILDSEGTVVEEWPSSDQQTHVVEGLKTGVEYTLKETVAPDGYTITADTTFTIREDGKVTSTGSIATDEEGNPILLVEDKLASEPSFEKKIKDTNDSTGETSDWQDSADYDIGDEVPYKLSAVLADNVTDYHKYRVTFHDEMEESLTFNEIRKVTVNGEEVTDYELTSSEHTFQLTLTWGSGSEKISDETLNEAVVEVFFTAILNENAVLGSQGNVNKAMLEYSSKPGVDQSGKPFEDTKETQEDFVIAFTYKVDVNKVDENGNALDGAAFKLEKKLADGGLKVVEKDIEAGTGSTFSFKGLDDGDYILTETEAPKKYRAIDPIEFTVTADHKVEWTNLSDRNDILTSLTGNVTTGELKFKTEEDMSGLTGDITNTRLFNGVELEVTKEFNDWSKAENVEF